jgi:hypothetical protein
MTQPRDFIVEAEPMVGSWRGKSFAFAGALVHLERKGDANY